MHFTTLHEQLQELGINCQTPADLYPELVKLCDSLGVPRETGDNAEARRIVNTYMKNNNHPDRADKVAAEENKDRDEVYEVLTERSKVIIVKYQAFKLLIKFFNFPNPSQAQLLTCINHNLIFHNNTEFQEHMKQHLFKCNKCVHTATTKELLMEHIKTHNNFQCETCHKVFTTKGNLNTHKQLHDNIDYSCPTCGKKLTRKRDINEHDKIVHKGKKIKCTLGCTREFDDRRNEKRHRQTHKTEKDLECNFKEALACKFKTKHQENLEKHIMRKHTSG